jgi:hypothetical protein
MTTNIPRNQPRQRTEGQLKFLRDLITQIAAYNRQRAVELWEQFRQADNAGLLTFTNASVQIDLLKIERNDLRDLAIATRVVEPVPPRPRVIEGSYAVDTDEGHLAFYQVEVSPKGFYTVSLQASDELRKLPWPTARGVLAKIEQDPQAAAIRYGKELGICGICHRTLTNEESRARGIGPVCASKF